MQKRIPFAFETVFSHWKRKPDGSHESKADEGRRAVRAARAFEVAGAMS